MNLPELQKSYPRLNTPGTYAVMSSMKTITVILLSWLLAFAPVMAEPTNELDPKAAVKLIASLNDISETPIAIASIIAGTKTENKFEASHVRRVTSIHPVIEEGSKVRRARCYDFYWNETYGWFVYEKRTGRGGDEIWIWSESMGDLVIK